MNFPSFFTSELFIHLSILSVTFLATWVYCLRGDWVSDDWEGVHKFSDRYDAETEEKIDWYDHDLGKVITDTGKHSGRLIPVGNPQKSTVIRYKNTQFNPHIEWPGNVVRWLRLNLGKKFVQIGKNKKGHEVYGFVQDRTRHHIISLVVHFSNILLSYFFLCHITTPQIALISSILFCVHPITVQSVAWVSGIGYLLSLCFSLLAFNIPFWIPNIYISVILAAFFTFLATASLLSGMANFVIFAFLGFWWHSAACLLITIICYIIQATKVVKFRTDAFKEQKMERSTYLNWRKPIVMMKTFFYYMIMIPFPKRLGLYHEWGYHYDDKMERPDRMFWGGTLILSLLLILFWKVPELRFGLLWMVVYLGLFLNIITAQQTVVDRYAFLSCFGFSVVLGTIFAHFPMWVSTLLIGIYLMRTWSHLPTYDNEVKFYQSNVWNFPKSEVALGNLGVTYMRVGLNGMAMDSWHIATQINPHYDVPWYNLYSIMKANGQWPQARDFLRKCVDAKVCHFPDLWNKELDQVEGIVKQIQPISTYLGSINKYVKEASCNSNFQSK